MGEFLKETYFTMVRIILVITFSIYGVLGINEGTRKTGVSIEMLLLVSLIISCMAVREMIPKSVKIYMLAALWILFAVIMRVGGSSFILIGFLLAFETLMQFGVRPIWYLLPFAGVFIDSEVGVMTQFITTVLLSFCYLQHEFVVAPYKKRMLEDTKEQQYLKKDIESREYAARAERRKNMIMAENKIFEERAALSQTLHDKLGHNINGSIYQLEASKVIMEKDPEKTKSMIQAVIDQLRTGMDEIRAILRKERPEKKQMALLQLYELCEDCNNKGVEAELATEGDMDAVPSDIWEVILDNAFEAVSNSMKYSRCTHISMEIVVMNKMIRCDIVDDGIGCSNIVDGMGLSGMRQRIRGAGGTISFESEAGFKVSMLIPM